jgi:hypothetical protein
MKLETKEMKRTIAILVSILAVVILTAAFIWTDFHMSTSQTKIESQVTTYGIKGQASGELPAHLPVQIYVEGDDLFSKVLRDQLRERLEATPRFNQVSILGMLPEKSNQPVLLIDPGEAVNLWTPIYGRSRFSINLIFASDGDISWRNEDAVRMNSSAVQVVRIRSDFTVNDSSIGLISRIYYQKYLAERVASQIAISLSSSIEAQVN